MSEEVGLLILDRRPRKYPPNSDQIEMENN